MESLFCIVIICLLFVSSCSADASFSWSDCGVKLNTNIHYEEASISPSVVPSGNYTLSINVQATIVSAVANANTLLTVWKDGELYLSVGIDDLCTILKQGSVALSCPLQPGPVSFTYTFDGVPALVTGDYSVKIVSSANSQELGCLMLSGHVDGLDSSTCQYTSSFHVSVDGSAFYSADSSNIQIGQYGDNVPAANQGSWGTFTSNFVGTSDVGGTLSTTNYVWGINGTLMYADSTTKIYTGDLFVGYQFPNNQIVLPVFAGGFNWTFANTHEGSTISGTFWFTPTYSFPVGFFDFPSVVGNLGPFSFQRQVDGSFLVSGSRTWCSCGIDDCGVCGGDGSFCQATSSLAPQYKLSQTTITALIVGLVGGVICLVAVVALYYTLRDTKKSNKILHDQQDLIVTPEKPDYGTLAMDDVINESDRVGEL